MIYNSLSSHYHYLNQHHQSLENLGHLIKQDNTDGFRDPDDNFNEPSQDTADYI
jgi:hypothetical protein